MESGKARVYLGNIPEKMERVLNREIEHLGDGEPVIQNGERFFVVAGSFAFFALGVNVGQKIHLDFFHSLPFAGFAPASLNVKRKPPGLVAAAPRVARSRKKFTDKRKCACVRGGIGARRPPNGGLVYYHYFIEMLKPSNFVVSAGIFARSVKMPQKRPRQNIAHQRGFSRPGNARDRHKFA